MVIHRILSANVMKNVQGQYKLWIGNKDRFKQEMILLLLLTLLQKQAYFL